MFISKKELKRIQNILQQSKDRIDMIDPIDSKIELASLRADLGVVMVDQHHLEERLEHMLVKLDGHEAGEKAVIARLRKYVRSLLLKMD